MNEFNDGINRINAKTSLSSKLTSSSSSSDVAVNTGPKAKINPLFTGIKGYYGEVNKVNGISIKHGVGKLYSMTNGDIYKGSFVDNRKSGLGTFYYANGDVYHGNYINDERSGAGYVRYFNGCMFNGHFTNNVKDGDGYFSVDKTYSYTAFWVNGKREEFKGPNGKTVKILVNDANDRDLESEMQNKIFDNHQDINEYNIWTFESVDKCIPGYDFLGEEEEEESHLDTTTKSNEDYETFVDHTADTADDDYYSAMAKNETTAVVGIDSNFSPPPPPRLPPGDMVYPTTPPYPTTHAQLLAFNNAPLAPSKNKKANGVTSNLFSKQHADQCDDSEYFKNNYCASCFRIDHKYKRVPVGKLCSSCIKTDEREQNFYSKSSRPKDEQCIRCKDNMMLNYLRTPVGFLCWECCSEENRY